MSININKISIKNEDIEFFLSLIRNAKQNDGKILLFGNGGSAAIASHVSVDLTKACNVPAQVFHDSAMLTCFANDFGYENVYKETINFYASSNDLVILISSSGESKNMLNAAVQCKKMQIPFYPLTGFSDSNSLKTSNEFGYWVDSKNYNIIEAMHLVFLLNICEIIRLERLS